VQVFKPVNGAEFILGAVGVLQFDVTMERLKAEYNVNAVYEGVDFTTARWICAKDRKRLEEFQKKNQHNLAIDAEGELTYLAASEWRLQHTIEQWEGVEFLKSREYK